MTPRRARAAARIQHRLRRTVPSTLVAAAHVRPSESSSLRERDQARAAEAGRDLGIPADISERLRAGKLEQACPDCGVWEAAGAYCTGCYRPMGPDDWYSNGDETRRRVAHQRAAEKAQARVKRPRGRPRRHVDDPAPVTTTPAFSPEAGFWPA